MRLKLLFLMMALMSAAACGAPTESSSPPPEAEWVPADHLNDPEYPDVTEKATIVWQEGFGDARGVWHQDYCFGLDGGSTKCMVPRNRNIKFLIYYSPDYSDAETNMLWDAALAVRDQVFNANGYAVEVWWTRSAHTRNQWPWGNNKWTLEYGARSVEYWDHKAEKLFGHYYKADGGQVELNLDWVQNLSCATDTAAVKRIVKKYVWQRLMRVAGIGFKTGSNLMTYGLVCDNTDFSDLRTEKIERDFLNAFDPG